MGWITLSISIQFAEMRILIKHSITLNFEQNRMSFTWSIIIDTIDVEITSINSTTAYQKKVELYFLLKPIYVFGSR